MPTIRIPTLTRLAAEIRGLDRGANHSQYLYQRLHQVLVRARSAQSAPFYSLRALAVACRLHPSTVADLYARLEADGLLVRVRASRTLIAPHHRRRAKPHQVIAMPVWLPGLTMLADWRLFFVCLQDELIRHGAVVDFIFYRQGEEVEPQFIRRVKAHRPDLVLWHEPHPQADKDAILRLTDAGLPVAALRDRLQLPRLPGWWIDRRPAYRQILRAWQAAGLWELIIPQWPVPADQPQDAQLSEVLKETAFRVRYETWSGKNAAGFLNSLAGRGGGVIWEDMFFHAGLNQSARPALQRLYRNHRVLLTRSRQLPRETPADVRVDVLDFDCRAVALRVARDLARGALLTTSPPGTVEYSGRTRVGIAEIIAAGDLI